MQTLYAMRFVNILFVGGVLILWGVLGWFYYKENYLDKEICRALDKMPAQELLRDVVIGIENYKFSHGNYPSNLEDFRNGILEFGDLYYELRSDKRSYYLFTKGKDCKDFTRDDLYPNLTENEMKHVGLKIPVNDDYKNIK